MDKRVEANLRVKQSIVNALFDLLGEKNITEISVQDIVKRAKVARQSYYRNFSSKEEIIDEFFHFIHLDMLSTLRENHIHSLNYNFIFYYLNILLKHREKLLILYRHQFVQHSLETINRFVEEAAGDMPYNSIDRYLLYYFAGAMYNTAMNWLRNGAVESCESVAQAICKFMSFDLNSMDLHLYLE